MKHPFVIFTDFPWVWGPLYSLGILIAAVLVIYGEPYVALFFGGGVIGSFVIISFWSVIIWIIGCK